MKKSNTVFGIVTDRAGLPLANLKVEIFDIDLRKWELLADTITDREGKYSLKWGHEQLSGRGKKTGDIAVRISTLEKNTELYRSSMDEVRFNADPREEINIIIRPDLPAEVVEFQQLVKDVQFLAKGVAIVDLQENQEHRDITFLSKELEVPTEKIEHLVVAHRLQKISKADADFFYALLRNDTLLHNNVASRLSARLAIGIHTEIKPLLYDVALTDPTIIKASVKKAISEKVVASSADKKFKQNLKLIANYREEAEAYYQNEHPKRIIEILTSLCKFEKLDEVQRIFKENKNDLNTFFRKIAEPSFFDTKEDESTAKINIELGRILGFGNEVLPKVIERKKIKKPGDIRKLAKLNTAAWVKEIKAANPKVKDDAVIKNYASTVVRRFEKAFPTLAYAAQLEREKDNVLSNQKKIVSFFNKYDDFDFQKHNVDFFLKEKKVKKKEKEAISEELKSVQRVFRLIPHYGKTNALRKEKIHSAQNIVATGETHFVNEIAPKAGFSAKEATDIYKKAETRHLASILMVGELHDQISAGDIAALNPKSLSKKLEAVSKDFPNLKSLFEGTDTCECEHCRSVYSPAAYLVEILEFLGNRTVVTGNARSVLFNRRPDLGEIDLSCANANTPVPYIDLVCELLEEAISPDPGIDFSGDLSDGSDPLTGIISNALYTTLQAAGLTVTPEAVIYPTETDLTSSASLPHYLRDTKVVCKIENTGGTNYKVYRLRQTLSSAEELDAAPEYVNADAYTELNDQFFAFKLPFDLNHTEARAYFNRFDVDRAELMKAFQVGSNPEKRAIAAEHLGLTHAEREIIIAAPAPNNNAAQQEFWNVTAPGDVVDHLEHVDHFLNRTDLTYRELDTLLKLSFIDKNNNLFIEHADLSCDTATKKIANLDLDALDRMHRFLRLQKVTGWDFEELDAIISQSRLGNGDLDNNCLIRAAQLKEISEKTKISLEDLTGCFGEIPHTILTEDAPKPLYFQIFLNKAKNGTVNENLTPDKVDGSQLLSTYLDYIATSLQLKSKDLELLLLLLPNGDLTFSNLSYLFLFSRLSQKLRLTAEDLSVLIELSGIDISQAPQTTLEFISLVENFSGSPIKATDVKFILTHDASNLSDREIKDEKIAELLGKLKEGYAEITEEHKSAFDDNLTAEEQVETLIKILSALENLSEEDVKTIVKFLDKDWTSATDAKQFIDDKFDEGIVRTKIDLAIDVLDAVPDGNDTSAEQKALVKVLLDAIADFNIEQNQDLFLQKMLADSFKSEAGIIAPVVAYARLGQSAPGTDLISELLYNDFGNPVNAANYPQQYQAIRLLHKMLPLIDSFNLSGSEVEWYLKHNADLGWLELDTIPYETGQTAVSLETYLDFVKTVAYSAQYSPVANPLDPEQPVNFFTVTELALPGSTATRAEFLQALSFLTGYTTKDLDDVDAYLFAVYAASNYHDIRNWESLFKCAGYLRKLSATVDQVKEYIKPVLTQSEVIDLRATLKARYSEDTWLSTLKEIMDTIRPQKRDALVAYLLATNPGIKDKNDLYEYFLVDVEMDACMPSSRIVQAHNSIQLFVQRCLMGLEPDAIANTDSDPNWDQWKWMKNYRIWEANRKVFLYPENWYEVSLSDDKTFLLTELIDEIQQNELTNYTAETALKKYLEKLDNISFLEVMASWYDVPTRDMHVVARTKGGDPAIYYYRRFDNERYWTPWEKIELDISGDHLLAFKRNGRLHLAWPVFSEEPQPDQASIIPSSTQGSSAPNDKPKKKLKLQLAISEYADKKWRQKTVSKEALHTPTWYTTEDHLLEKHQINLVYFELTDQVIFFKSEWKGDDFHRNIGIFNIAGCKGYPEPVFEGDKSFPDFLPDFKEAKLNSQRYRELTERAFNDLSVKNGISIYWFIKLLNQTPGTFRISYPHQFTNIDLVSFLFQLFMNAIFSGILYDDRNRFEIPVGTLLPYFMEDSDHAYVIIPGFYKKTFGELGQYSFNDKLKGTASDVFQLQDDIVNWVKKIIREFQDNPPPDLQTAIQIIIADPEFQDVIMEMAKYQIFDPLLFFMVGKVENEEFDKLVKALGLVYGEQFKNLYHPLVCQLRTILNKDGIPALMKRETQLQKTIFNFETHYQPNKQLVVTSFYKNPDGTLTESFPIEDLDFNSDGSYSTYNWDLFYRVPLHIATSLARNQRFEEAMTWFHYIFNPTGALPGTGVQKYWVTKPFYLNQSSDYTAQRIDFLMYAISDPANAQIKELEFAISEWRNKPFRPDTVARFRPVAYQKAVLMKYIDNLTEWGDYLFRQDTMESVAQATQMYILADKLLGPKPRIVPPVVKPPYQTYKQVKAKLDSFGNALIEFENILPDISALPEGGVEIPPPPYTLSMLYFCIPPNEKMMEYWDRVEDRLFKIRHCQNIDGVERTLALFAPPIDPGMLVRAAAAGLDISAVIAGLNAPTPYYRFTVFSRQAYEMAQEVRALGVSLRQALERKDAESLSLLNNELEIKLLKAITDTKKLQIKEAEERIEIMNKAKDTILERHSHFANIENIISNEQLHLDKLAEAHEYQTDSQGNQTLAIAMALIPDLTAGAAGFGGSPVVTGTWGGTNMFNAANAGAGSVNINAATATYEANRASILGGFDRRTEEWDLQKRLAEKELIQIDKQITGSEIRKEIAESDLQSHELQIENAEKTREFMQSNFTNKELYDWMIGQISSVYFKAYKLAHDLAKKAERCYRFELGNDDSYISFGYWDSMKKGLNAADHLIYDIKRMQAGYLNKNKREYEITKNVSLALLDPLALVSLRATGTCIFDIPEALYDLDHPGHYFRRLKSVSTSIPCIAGPNTSISAKLSLVTNKYRKNTNEGTGYVEDSGNDNRFIYNVGAIQSIATSNAQNDSGMFELDFKDERYLPFEGTGAISTWRLELPTEVRQFDYNTISDVILHVNYTSREGGSGLKTLANGQVKAQLDLIQQGLEQTGLHIAVNMKNDLPTEWHLLKENGTIPLTLDSSRLPYMAQAVEATPAISSVMFIVKATGNPASFVVNVDGAPTTLPRKDELKMCNGNVSTIGLGTSFTLSVAEPDKVALEELMMVIKYTF